jgi:hypothetical protein
MVVTAARVMTPGSVLRPRFLSSGVQWPAGGRLTRSVDDDDDDDDDDEDDEDPPTAAEAASADDDDDDDDPPTAAEAASASAPLPLLSPPFSSSGNTPMAPGWSHVAARLVNSSFAFLRAVPGGARKYVRPLPSWARSATKAFRTKP